LLRQSASLAHRIGLRILVILLCTAVGALWLVHTGPVAVIRIMTTQTEITPFWYMLSAFPILGMLVADLVELLLGSGFSVAALELGAQILVLIVLSNLRLGFNLPMSGHALLVSYFVFRRVFIPPDSSLQNRIELGIALVAFVMIAYPKLVWWTDPITLGMGILVGLSLAWVSRRVREQAPEATQAVETPSPSKVQ